VFCSGTSGCRNRQIATEGSGRGSAHRRRRQQVGERTAVLELTGEHDLATEDAIERLLLRLVAENASVVVDVTNAGYVDSSFLGNLLRVDEQPEPKVSEYSSRSEQPRRCDAPSTSLWFLID